MMNDEALETIEIQPKVLKTPDQLENVVKCVQKSDEKFNAVW